MRKSFLFIFIIILFVNIGCAWDFPFFKNVNDKSKTETDINLGGKHSENETQTGDVNNGLQGDDIGKMIEQMAIAGAIIIIAITFLIGKFTPNKKQKLLEYKLKSIKNYIDSSNNENIKRCEIKDFINNI